MRFGVVILFVLLCSCASAPIKKEEVTKAEDYKHYYNIKEESVHKTIPQRIVGVFKKKKSEKKPSKPVSPPSSMTPSKRGKIQTPTRRIRQTNTNSVSMEPGKLMPMGLRSEESIVESKHNFELYFIYMQAFIIGVLSIYTYIKFRGQKKKPQRQLNL